MTDVDTPETREAFKPLIVKHTFHDKSLTQDEMESMLVIFCDHAQFDEMIKSGFQHNNELKQTNSKVNNKTDDKTDGVDANPTAAKTAQENKVKVIIANFKNLNNILNGQPFKGTVIQ
jgi:uridylate kinase